MDVFPWLVDRHQHARLRGGHAPLRRKPICLPRRAARVVHRLCRRLPPRHRRDAHLHRLRELARCAQLELQQKAQRVDRFVRQRAAAYAQRDSAVAPGEADDEVLCSRCCGLLYPRASTGALHPFFAGFKVRVVQEGDKSGTNVVVRPPLSAEELDEEQWEALGRDLSRPHALEAPKKNFLHATSKSNRPVPKYVEGDAWQPGRLWIVRLPAPS